jgi:DNA-binding response OmpR family regulator
MSKIAENIIGAIMRSGKENFTKDEIFKLVLDITEDNQTKTIKSGAIELNRLDMTVSVKGKKTKIQRLEFELLFYLMQNEGNIVERHILMRDIWGTDVCVGTRTIDVCVCKLKKIIGAEKIKSIKKVGYLLQV